MINRIVLMQIANDSRARPRGIVKKTIDYVKYPAQPYLTPCPADNRLP